MMRIVDEVKKLRCVLGIKVRVALDVEPRFWSPVFNSREAIAEDVIDFYDSKRSIGFLRFFYRTYYSFRRHFDLKAKVSKICMN